jgi:DNA transformation protein
MSEFVDSLHEVFTDFGPIEAKRMFGGYGIYHSGLMFGLVADDVLFLKTDKRSQHRFEDKGLSPFLYEKSGKQVKMSYFMAPEEIYDDPQIARAWAVLAYEAALRSDSAKKK